MASRTAAGVPGHLLPPAARRKSAAAKGSHYKARTKEWLERQGFVVGHLERMMWIRGGREACAACGQARMFPSKQDQFGADLIAVRADANVVFVQVKLGEGNVLPARREFLRFPFPPTASRWIVCWKPRAREPKVIDCTADTPATVPAARPRPQNEALF